MNGSIGYVRGKNVYEFAYFPSDYYYSYGSQKIPTYGSGSRITYNRDFKQIGLGLVYIGNKFDFGMQGKTSGSYQPSSTAIDEDFYTTSSSQARSRRLIPPFYILGFPTHSPYLFNGLNNFAYSKGKNEIINREINLNYRYFFDKASPDPWKKSFGMYLISSIDYSYYKYKISDSLFFYNSPSITYFSPLPWINITYSNSYLSGGVGLGIIYSFGNWSFDGSIQATRSEMKSRDFHVLRNLTIFHTYKGYGYIHKSSLSYKLDKSYLIKFSIIQTRAYLYGTSKYRPRGNIKEFLNSLDGSRNYIYNGLKDAYFELTLSRKFLLK